MATAADEGTLTNLSVLAGALAGGIFLVKTFVDIATAMFGLPEWGAKKIVQVGALVVGKLFAGAMFVASMFASVAGAMFGGIATRVPSKLSAKSKGAGKSIGKITAAGFTTGFIGAIATGVFISSIVNAVLDQLGVPEGGWPKPKIYNPATGQWEERAKGGPVARGKRYLVGERGPEMFVPGSSGRIIPNGSEQILNAARSRRAVSGSTVYNVNVNVSPTADKAAIGQEIIRAIQAASGRDGGVGLKRALAGGR